MDTCYQLRKIGLPASVEKVKNCHRITSNTTLIGRGQAVDIFLDSNIRKGLISRAHAQIIQNDIGVNGETEYEVFDTSLNGTYVNDVRIKGSVILKDGDWITFGHLRGSLIKPGTLAPQKETEFLFKFEKCPQSQPELEDKMVDLTEKELNNNSSSVFMSPKSPVAAVGENINSHIVLTNAVLAKGTSPSEKKMKYSPVHNLCGEQVIKKSRYSTSDEEDLKTVVATATSKINSPGGETSDDGSFFIDLDSKNNEVTPKPVSVSKPNHILHPRNKGLLNTNSPTSRNNNSAVSEQHKNQPGFTKNSAKRKGISEKVMNGIDSDESEIESESESEYIEDSDSEKSEEIPDESSDNEYNPKGKSLVKKQTPVAPVRLKAKTSQQKDNRSKSQTVNKKKKLNNFVHDKCDSMNCKIPSSNLKTVTWVQCDDCDAWYHVSCSGLTIADAKKKDTIFRCGCS